MRDLGSNVSNLCDVIDTREVLARIAELEDDYRDDEGEINPAPMWSDDDNREYQELTALVEAAREHGGDLPEDGVTLIRETYFAEHIRDFYDDCHPEFYEIDPKKPYDGPVLVSWSSLMSRAPFNNIDWDAVAEDARHDYSLVEYDGVTYYYL